MDSEKLRKEVVEKFETRKEEFLGIKKNLEALIISILVDCKDILDEVKSLNDVVTIIVDEIDDRTNTGVFDIVDGALVKKVFQDYVDNPKIEKWFNDLKSKAFKTINEATNGK